MMNADSHIEKIKNKQTELLLNHETIITKELETFEEIKETLMEQKELDEIEFSSKIQILKTKLKNLNSKCKSKIKYEETLHKERMKELLIQKRTDKDWYENIIHHHYEAHKMAAKPDDDDP